MFHDGREEIFQVTGAFHQEENIHHIEILGVFSGRSRTLVLIQIRGIGRDVRRSEAVHEVFVIEETPYVTGLAVKVGPVIGHLSLGETHGSNPAAFI